MCMCEQNLSYIDLKCSLLCFSTSWYSKLNTINGQNLKYKFSIHPLQWTETLFIIFLLPCFGLDSVLGLSFQLFLHLAPSLGCFLLALVLSSVPSIFPSMCLSANPDFSSHYLRSGSRWRQTTKAAQTFFSPAASSISVCGITYFHVFFKSMSDMVH